MEVARGVHLIETYAQCALLVDDRLVLIDTGIEDSGRDILDYVRKIGQKLSDISTIIVTHTHPDHVGGLAAIKEKSGARVAAHEIEADFISRKKNYTGPPGIQRHRGVEVDDQLRDGQRYQELLVVHTPGHTLGSMALLDERRSLLIAGDSVNNEERRLKPMDDQYNVDPRKHRESIKKLARYQFDVMIMGHGYTVDKDASKMVQELASRL